MRWRLLFFVALGACLVGLVASVASAYLTVSGSGTGSASTGSVALTVNAPATHSCSFPNLAPGDLSGSSTCALSVTYSGSLSAFVSLTVAIQSKPGAGGHALYDGTNTAGLTLSLSDGHRSFTLPVGPGTTGGSCPAGLTCWTAANDLAAWYSGSTPSLTFTDTSPAVTFTLTPLFATGNGNAYQGSTATVTMTAQAVQVPANPLPAGCTTSTVGQPCPASGTFTWS